MTAARAACVAALVVFVTAVPAVQAEAACVLEPAKLRFDDDDGCFRQAESHVGFPGALKFMPLDRDEQFFPVSAERCANATSTPAIPFCTNSGSTELGRLPIVIAEQSTNAFPSAHLSVERLDFGGWGDPAVAEPLVVPLLVVLGHVLADDAPEMSLAKWDDPVETLLFDRPDKALRVRVQIRALRRQPDGRHAGTLEHRMERRCVDWVPIVDDVAAVREDARSDVREVSRDLNHAGAVGLVDYAPDLDPAALEPDDDQHEVANQAARGHDFHR
jgi:hypothetical protein